MMRVGAIIDCTALITGRSPGSLQDRPASLRKCLKSLSWGTPEAGSNWLSLSILFSVADFRSTRGLIEASSPPGAESVWFQPLYSFWPTLSSVKVECGLLRDQSHPRSYQTPAASAPCREMAAGLYSLRSLGLRCR